MEGKIYTDLFLQQPLGFHVDDMNDLYHWELVIPAPYNKIYRQYLRAMIHYADAEPDRYNMDIQLFNQSWHELVVWFGQDYDISDRNRNRRVTVSFGDFSDIMDAVLFRVPPRCAFVAGRVVVKSEYTSTDPEVEKFYANLWFGDEVDNVGQTDMKLYKRKSYTVPMLIGDVEGSDIGVTVTQLCEGGEAYLTGILCVPEEELLWLPERKVTATPLDLR